VATVRFPVTSAADLVPTTRSAVDGSPDATPVMVEVVAISGARHRVPVPLDESSARRLARAVRYSRVFRHVVAPALAVIVFVAFIWISELFPRIGGPAALAALSAVGLLVAALTASNVIVARIPRYRPRLEKGWVIIGGLDPAVAAEWAAANRGTIEVVDR
jgi:cytochrome c oxidase assembly factor CtaG